MNDISVPISVNDAELRKKLVEAVSKLKPGDVERAAELTETLNSIISSSVGMLALIQTNPSLVRMMVSEARKKVRFDAYKAAREHDSWHYEEHDFGTLEIPYCPWWKRVWWRVLDVWNWLKWKVGLGQEEE